jgi:predicted dehydrogenase
MRFAVIGLDHRHVYEITAHLVEAGMECAGYWPETSDPGVLEGFQRRFPHLQAVADKDRLLDDPTIAVIAIAAIPADRAPLAIAAMRRGKDVLVDKPGITDFAQLAEVERTVAETGRIFSVCFSERFQTPSTAEALALVRAGAIGRVIQTVGLGPHRLNRPLRPAWFFDAKYYGGILVDIASHQIDQFLVFTDSRDAEIGYASVGSYAVGDGFEDFGEIALRNSRATGYIRVDWFTADGLSTWGDGRLTILGTEGTIELRKYIDVEGKPGTEHLFLVNNQGTRYIDCSGRPLTYFRDFANDVRDRSETAMTQTHCLTVCRLALQAQAKAVRL